MTDLNRDYGWLGRLGIGTPQGNPTVEAEMRRLIPLGVEYFTLRLTSESKDSQTRLIDYAEKLPEYMARYATLKLDGFLFACTASTYLVDPEHMRACTSAASERLGAPVFTAANAIADWLKQQKAEKIALLTPYPNWLNEHAINYWTSRGFDVKESCIIDIKSDDTYAIYVQQSANAREALHRLMDVEVDAFVISGTGMPSLPIIKEVTAAGHLIVSSNLALAIAGLKVLGQVPMNSDSWTSAP